MTDHVNELDALLRDPRRLVHTDPATVMDLLEHAATDADRVMAAIYRTSAWRFPADDPEHTRARRDVLAIDAARFGMTDLAADLAAVSIANPSNPTDPVRTPRPTPINGVAWATGAQVSTRLRRVLTTVAGAFHVEKAGVDGPTMVIAKEPPHQILRAWDLATGAQLWSCERDSLWRRWMGEAMSYSTKNITTSLDGVPVIAIVGGRSLIEVRDLRTGDHVVRFDLKHQLETGSLAACARNGRTVLLSTTYNSDGDPESRDSPAVDVHDLATGALVGRFDTEQDGAVLVAATTVDGCPIAITGASGDHTLRLWDLAAPHLWDPDAPQLWDLRNPHLWDPNAPQLDDLAEPPLNLAAPQPIGEPLTGHTGGLTRLVVTTVDDRPVALSGSYDGTVRRWDLRTGAAIGEPMTFPGDGWVGTLKVAATDAGATAVTRRRNGQTHMWNVATGRPVGRPFVVPDATIVGLTQVDDAPAMVVSRHGGTHIWSTGPEIRSAPRLAGLRRPITRLVSASLDGRPVIVASSASELCRYDLSGRIVGEPLVANASVILAMTVLPDNDPSGLTVVVATRPTDEWDAETRLRWFDLATWSSVRVSTDESPTIFGLAATVQGGRSWVIAGGSDSRHSGQLQMWNSATGNPVGEPMAGHNWSVRAVATTTVEGRAVAVSAGGQDKTVRMWDLRNGAELSCVTGHDATVTELAISDHGERTIAVSGDDKGVIRLWDLGSSVSPPPLTGHVGAVTAIATGELDGRPVAISGGADSTVRVWDLVSCEQIGPPVTVPDPVSALTVVPGAVAVGFGLDLTLLTAPVNP